MTRKNFKNRVGRTIAVAMSTMLVMSSSSINVMAASIASDSNATKITDVSGNGSLEDPTTTQTTTITTDSETKQKTTTVDVTISGTGTNADGATVDLNITTGSVTLTDENDLILTESGKEAGKEVTTETSTTTEEIDATPTNNVTTAVGDTTTTTTTGTTQTVDASRDPETSKDIDLEYTGDVSVTVTPGTEETDYTETNKAQLANENITVPQNSSNTVTDEETGIKTTTTVTYKALTDSNGNVYGYTTETTITTEAPTVDTVTNTSEPTITETTGETTTDVTTNTTIVLPEKPAASETVDETTGQKTTVTVEELFDNNGNVVGYQSKTTVADANGNVITSSANSVFGVKETTTTTSTTPTTTESTTTNLITTTTTTLITTAVTTSGEQVTATDRTVWAQMSEVTSGENHGDVKTNSIQPDLENLQPAEGTYDKDTDLYNRTDGLTGTLADGFTFVYQGDSGLESSIRVDPNGDADGNSNYIAHQFILIDEKGNKHFAYCADFDTSVQDGYNYNMVNVEDASYYDSTAAQMIVAIARNGYWGTPEGSDGSLSVLKTNLLAARTEALANNEKFPLTEEQINNLTHGQALTATQAALWVYGNGSQTTRMDENKIAGDNFALGNSEEDLLAEAEDRAAVNALYQYFRSLDPETVDDPTSFINAEDFAQSATITVKELAKNELGQLLEPNTDDKTDNDVYNTDITFALSIVPSEINDDLIVTVYDANGKELAKRRLAGTDTNSVNRVKANADGTYTIKNIQLAENVNITLNLSGTQALDTGVYLYSSENRAGTTSQTFVGIANGDNTRDVNLNVDLKFSVTEPTAKVVTTKSSETTERTDVTVEERTDIVTEATVTATVVVTTEEKTEHSWENSWTYEAPTEPTTPVQPRTPNEPDDPDPTDDPDTPVAPTPSETPADPEITEISDDPTPLGIIDDNDIPLGVLGASDIPRALAPATGDASAIWAILTAISGFLLSGFLFIDKKRKNDQLK